MSEEGSVVAVAYNRVERISNVKKKGKNKAALRSKKKDW